MFNLIERRMRDNLIRMNGVYSVLYLYLYVGLRGGQKFSTVHAPKRTRSTDRVSDNHTTKPAIPMQCGGKPQPSDPSPSVRTHRIRIRIPISQPPPRTRLDRALRLARPKRQETDGPGQRSGTTLSATLRSFLPQSSPHRVQLAT
jgi:hypothetical protein